MSVTSVDDLERLATTSELYLAGAFRVLARLGRRSPEMAAAAIAEGQALLDALTPDPQPTKHWSCSGARATTEGLSDLVRLHLAELLVELL